ATAARWRRRGRWPDATPRRPGARSGLSPARATAKRSRHWRTPSRPAITELSARTGSSNAAAPLYGGADAANPLALCGFAPRGTRPGLDGPPPLDRDPLGLPRPVGHAAPAGSRAHLLLRGVRALCRALRLADDLRFARPRPRRAVGHGRLPHERHGQRRGRGRSPGRRLSVSGRVGLA